jgi:hypothetical protein
MSSFKIESSAIFVYAKENYAIPSFSSFSVEMNLKKSSTISKACLNRD